MLKKIKIKATMMLALSFLFISITPAAAKDAQPTDAAKQTQLQQRIDFGNAYIMGQSIKSGAVYLLHRKKAILTVC